MSSRAFEVGDRVHVVETGLSRGPASFEGATGIVRSIDKSRRRTEPYYVYYVELPEVETLIDFEYRELELAVPVSEEISRID